MTDDGVFAVHRGVFSHPVLAGEPYTRVQAWLWLLSNAVWKSTRVRVKDSMFSLERGQCAYSLRFLGSQWKWSKNRVAAFLSSLSNEQMIGTQAGRDATLITICNYDEYQFTPGNERDANQDADGTQTGRRRDKEEELNKRKNGNAPSAPLLGRPTEEAELYSRGKQVLGKSAGGLISKLLKSKQGNVALARAAIEQASTKQDPSEYIARIVRGPAGAGGKIDLADPQDVMRFILS